MRGIYVGKQSDMPLDPIPIDADGNSRRNFELQLKRLRERKTKRSGQINDERNLKNSFADYENESNRDQTSGKWGFRVFLIV